jgi:Zn-dependent protease/CBS domain-containing protein
MSKQAIPLGHIGSISIGLDYSWFLIFGLLTWFLAVHYYPSELKDWPTIQYWLMGAITAIMLFASVLLHELGHSVIALRYKIPVRRITLMVFGGVAEIGGEPPNAAAEFFIAIAGPVVSLTLGALLILLLPFLAGVEALQALVKYLGFINGFLALFNLIPGFPLDGGRVFRAAVWAVTRSLRQATLIAASLGRGIGYLFIFLGVWQMFGGNYSIGLWTILIGWFLENAAAAQIQQQMVQDQLTGYLVSQAMSHSYSVVPAETTLQQLVDHHILGQGQRSFVIKQGDEMLGLLTLHHLKTIARSEWPTTPVTQAMSPATNLKWVRPDTGLRAALAKMDRDGVSQLPVMENGQLAGMLSREDIISFLRTLRELGT